MVRKFLNLVAICVVLVIVGAIALAMWSDKATQIAFVPTAEFVDQQPFEVNAYQDPAMWYSRPGFGAPNDPALWQPPEAAAPVAGAAARAAEAAPAPVAPDGAATPQFAVFFVHPTSYINRNAWNAPLDDPEADTRAKLFIKGMASPFNQAAEIWAPKYRQATFGAFLTDDPAADQAIDAAYRDVSQAFDYFLASIRPDMPIVLAGHSQGAAHLTRLLKERIAGTPLQDRVAMAYLIGWPISVEHDLPVLGLPACATAAQAGCIMDYSSFAEPAEPGLLLERYRTSAGYDGLARGEGGLLCVNPLTGTIGGEADASANLGTLRPNDDLSSGELVPGAVPARCSPRGLLLIGDPPQMGPGVLPGNNFHVYDIPLFWRNLQADVDRRMRAWAAQHP
ncbi:DUF3089 domain-containing protein [Altererythrobacter salegens]|uniref:DUF3089 domain-containing protein n=1 Tax=Croceibacterium salegens TaxID=1737568 RepID=A0A6I4SWS3_9SPHN|nr:DUF3089 domain-containing protein [Croceibacterium salegens]MXO60293.1 DUF3089 domain-containing protein [Croceibacterium salegens]